MLYQLPQLFGFGSNMLDYNRDDIKVCNDLAFSLLTLHFIISIYKIHSNITLSPLRNLFNL